LKKADRKDGSIQDANDEFLRLYKQDMVKNFAQLQQQAQVVKDSYFKLIKNAASGMTHQYQLLQGQVEGAVKRLKQNYPPQLNIQNQKKLEDLKRYCSDRVINEPSMEFSISCKKCGYSLSDILNYIDLVPSKNNDLIIIQSNFITEPPPDPRQGFGDDPKMPKAPRKIKFQVPGKKMTVREYKSLLTTQLTALASAQPDEEIELDIETL